MCHRGGIEAHRVRAVAFTVTHRHNSLRLLYKVFRLIFPSRGDCDELVQYVRHFMYTELSNRNKE